MRSARRTPFVEDIRFALVVGPAVGHFDGRKTSPFIERTCANISLKRPKSDLALAVLGHVEQGRTDTVSLSSRQDVKLVDPAFTNGQNAYEIGAIESAPNLASAEDMSSKIRLIFIRRV